MTVRATEVNILHLGWEPIRAFLSGGVHSLTSSAVFEKGWSTCHCPFTLFLHHTMWHLFPSLQTVWISFTFPPSIRLIKFTPFWDFTHVFLFLMSHTLTSWVVPTTLPVVTRFLRIMALGVVCTVAECHRVDAVSICTVQQMQNPNFYLSYITQDKTTSAFIHHQSISYLACHEKCTLHIHTISVSVTTIFLQKPTYTWISHTL